VSHPDLYDFPVTEIQLPSGMEQLDYTINGITVSFLSVKRGVLAPKVCLMSEKVLDKDVAITQDTQDAFTLQFDGELIAKANTRGVCFNIGANKGAADKKYTLRFKTDNPEKWYIPPI